MAKPQPCHGPDRFQIEIHPDISHCLLLTNPPFLPKVPKTHSLLQHCQALQSPPRAEFTRPDPAACTPLSSSTKAAPSNPAPLPEPLPPPSLWIPAGPMTTLRRWGPSSRVVLLFNQRRPCPPTRVSWGEGPRSHFFLYRSPRGAHHKVDAHLLLCRERFFHLLHFRRSITTQFWLTEQNWVKIPIIIKYYNQSLVDILNIK